MSINYNLYNEKLSYDIVSGLREKGHVSTISQEKMKELGRAIAKINLTNKVHPITGLNIASHNIELLNQLYLNQISEDEYVRQMAQTDDIVFDISEDPYLGDWMEFALVTIYCFSVILNKSFQDTVAIMDKYDNWLDFAVSGNMILSGIEWDLAEHFYNWNYPDNIIYFQWHNYYDNV